MKIIIFEYRKYLYLFLLFFLLFSTTLIINEYYKIYENSHTINFEKYCSSESNENFFIDKYNYEYTKDIEIEKRIDIAINRLTNCMIFIIISIGILLFYFFFNLLKNNIKSYFLEYYNYKIFIKNILFIFVITFIIFNCLNILFDLPMIKLSILRIIDLVKDYKYLILIGDIFSISIFCLSIILFKLCLKNSNA